MPPRANVDDWHDRLIQAAHVRHTSAVRNNNRNQTAWKKAIDLLERSKRMIYIPRTGQKAGMVTGIPTGIDGVILQILTRIVQGEEDIILPEHEGRNAHNVIEEKIVKNRQYRDSAYAILAALYLEYQGPGVNPQATGAVQRRAQRYTDNEIVYDYRARRQGAWKAKDSLRQNSLINEERTGGGLYNNSKGYSLTLSGAKACYHIFNRMYHPSKGNYELVEPRHGTVDPDGGFHPRGGDGGGSVRRGGQGEDFLGGMPQGLQRGLNINPFGLNNNQYLQDDDDDDDEYFGGEDYGLAGVPKNIVNNRSGKVGGTPATAATTNNKTVDTVLSVQRARLLRLDPQCANTIKKYHAWGLSVEEAWSLYEQGGEQTIKAKDKHTTATPKPTIAPAVDNNLVLFDAQTDLDLALELSKATAKASSTSKKQLHNKHIPPTPPTSLDYQDFEDSQDALQFAIELSKMDHVEYDSDATEDFEDVQVLSKEDLQTNHTNNNSSSSSSKKRARDVITLEDSQLTLTMPTSNGKASNSKWTVIDLSEGEQDGPRTPTSNSSWSNVPSPSPVPRSATKIVKSGASASSMKRLSAIPEVNMVDLCDNDDETWMNSGAEKQASRSNIPSSSSNTRDPFRLSQSCESPSSKRQKRAASYADDEIDLTHSGTDPFGDIDFDAPTHSTTPATSSQRRGTFASSSSVYNRMKAATSSRSSIDGSTSSKSSANSKPRPSILQSLQPFPDNGGTSNSRVTDHYDITALSADASLMLLVDNRERKKNATYRQFFKSIETYVNSRTSIGAAEVSLTVGDFLLAFTDSEDKQRWVADVAIERKCLSDIVTRSAEAGEGPHFRQERTLRYSGIKHPCFLIEGDLKHTGNQKPLTSQGYEEQNLQRLDVIQESTDLLAYLCGIVCRNVGVFRVKVLHTMVAMETAMMLAAISVVVADAFDRRASKTIKLPTLSSFQRHWNGKPRNSRQNRLTEELEAADISSDTIHRVERRFGDADALLSVYDLCDSKLHQEMLLSDITLSASNICEEALEKDACVGLVEMQRDSIRVAQQVMMEASGFVSIADNAAVIERETLVTLTSAMFESMEQMRKFEVNVKSTVLPDSEVSHGSYSWCELMIRGGLGGRQSTSTLGKRRVSSPIFFTEIPGFDVIEALAKAYDELMLSTPLMSQGDNNKDFELRLVRLAWAKLNHKMDAGFLARFDAAVQDKRYPQRVVLLEKLGGGGKTGACGRLKTAFATKVHGNMTASGEGESVGEEVVAAAASSSSSSNNSDVIQLDKHRYGISIAAARYLTAELTWILHLTQVVAQFELDYQLFHASGACPSKVIVSMFILEYGKQALLLYDDNNDNK